MCCFCCLKGAKRVETWMSCCFRSLYDLSLNFVLVILGSDFDFVFLNFSGFNFIFVVLNGDSDGDINYEMKESGTVMFWMYMVKIFWFYGKIFCMNLFLGEDFGWEWIFIMGYFCEKVRDDDFSWKKKRKSLGFCCFWFLLFGYWF
jgi:hypothetical protein